MEPPDDLDTTVKPLEQSTLTFGRTSLAATLGELNAAQKEAVTATRTGGVAVLAGPGSGKTKVLTTRVAWLIQEAGVKPEELVCVFRGGTTAKADLFLLFLPLYFPIFAPHFVQRSHFYQQSSKRDEASPGEARWGGGSRQGYYGHFSLVRLSPFSLHRLLLSLSRHPLA
jgi:hypothetical protein